MLRDDGPTIDEARRACVLNARRLVGRAVVLYEAGEFPMACFAAMTAIEECGKAFAIGIGRRAGGQGEADADVVHDPKKFRSVIRDHTGKTMIAAFDSLMINSSADRRQGKHKKSGQYRTSALILLGRSDRWMEVRNACLYVDVDLPHHKVQVPTQVVGEAQANYFIQIGYEVIAEAGFIGLVGVGPDPDYAEALSWAYDCIEVLTGFMDRHNVDVDELWFLAEPSPLREEAERRGR